MQQASLQGLAPDVMRRRCSVACIHSASRATEGQLYELWSTKGVQAAHDTLAADDVSVTNQKDKDLRTQL